MLDQINIPDDVRKLDPSELPELCDELRDFLLNSVSQTGGHLSASLGTVELTVALHYVFDTPNDKLVWDVGHQAYIHKILTDRREKMSGIRQKGGISGFPKREESIYDTFGTGHSSTSISAVLGMTLAADAQKRGQHNIAIIGDGAMTAGMVYEALNHAGGLEANMLVILNDNDMSISPNIGGLSKYLTRLISGQLYSRIRESGKKLLSSTPNMQRFTKKSEEHMKGMVMPGTIFEEMGFRYYGPVDGHDIDELVKILENLKKQKGPRLLHIVTTKGKGYAPAEKDPCSYHGVSAFNLAEGITPLAQKASDIPINPPTYTQVFGQWLCDMAAQDERLIGITPAMREGSGLTQFSEQFPDRYHDVAIAEQHAVTLAAGLACEGSKPVVAIYSTFLQRAYDQLIHDVAIQNLPVVFAIDRAGLVGADGATHSGNYDYSFLRCIPNMIIMAPADESECRNMLYTAFLQNSPTAVRYPRGKGTGIIPDKEMQALEVGQSAELISGSSIALLMFGSLRHACEEAATTLGATLINMRFIKPIDEAVILKLSESHDLLVTIEDNAIQGGAGSAVNEVVMQHATGIAVLNLGIPDHYIPHASQEDQLDECGLSAQKIIKQINHYANGRYCVNPLASIPSASQTN